MVGGVFTLKTIIYRKSDLVCVGQLQSNTTFEWEIEHNVIPNFKGGISDYDYLNVEYDRFQLERNTNGQIVVSEAGLSKEEEIFNIKQELSRLDIEVPRIIEDIVEQNNLSIHPSKNNIIQKKKSLRQRLNQL